MAILVPADMGDDDEVQCSECDAVFMVVFRRNAVDTRVMFCPFCGDDIEEQNAQPASE